MDLLDFTKQYCEQYNITEDDLTIEDIEFIEDCWYTGTEIKPNLRIIT